MADKIKSFFQKRIRDKKFKHAGKGYKLNESAPSTSALYEVDDIPTRHEPTDDAKVAGQAALARIEAKAKDDSKFNTSYASIQARVKREIQQEKQRLAKDIADKEANIANKANEINESRVETSVLAVTGVYYRCPLISEEILNKETWYERIEEFLSTQLMESEVGLSACLVIHSCNYGTERINYCVETLCKYLDNIINNPKEEKYWKIRLSNKIFQERVKKLKGSMELLKAAGFIQEKLMNQETEEDFLIWSPERSSIDNLKTLVDALNSTEPVELLLDRNVHVLLPSQAAERTELPAEFYLLSVQDLKREQSNLTKSLELNQMLLTSAMREKLMDRPKKIYQFTIIRIKFPDNITLQGTFEVKEKLRELVEFVKEHLANENFLFNLITDTRETLGEADYDKTLETLNLVPAVVLTFLNKSNPDSGVPPYFLKKETLSLLQS
ncbi:PREDICTED: UBX domain-containing protein 6 [Ceratosolen solmsi marchali]|uniref:UBX domain-containing protein 6 n=1 Tax=Ceratosolen solmsi marchali TaxID=326594 RepID=A0AAJ7E2X6_9HYME|nr:PREDICTED: UBX domain-containing protein 6 [Ceratosolen solmsi marchali]